jgi:hypothetical protein
MDLTFALLPSPWACLPLLEIHTQGDSTVLLCGDPLEPPLITVLCLPEHAGLFSAHAKAFQQWDVDRTAREQVFIPVLLGPGAPRFFPEADLVSMLQTASHSLRPVLVDSPASPI